MKNTNQFVLYGVTLLDGTEHMVPQKNRAVYIKDGRIERIQMRMIRISVNRIKGDNSDAHKCKGNQTNNRRYEKYCDTCVGIIRL